MVATSLILAALVVCVSCQTFPSITIPSIPGFPATAQPTPTNDAESSALQSLIISAGIMADSSVFRLPGWTTFVNDLPPNVRSAALDVETNPAANPTFISLLNPVFTNLPVSDQNFFQNALNDEAVQIESVVAESITFIVTGLTASTSTSTPPPIYSNSSSSTSSKPPSYPTYPNPASYGGTTSEPASRSTVASPTGSYNGIMAVTSGAPRVSASSTAVSNTAASIGGLASSLVLRLGPSIICMAAFVSYIAFL